MDIRINNKLKKDAHDLFKSLNTNRTAATILFIKKSIEEDGLPFEVHVSSLPDYSTLDGRLNMEIDEELKNKGKLVFSKLGMSLASAIGLFFKVCIVEKGLPFEVEEINKK